MTAPGSNDRTRLLPNPAVYAVAFALTALLLFSHAYLGWFSRYIADDYCTLGSLRGQGFWGSQVFWYTTWSGRYTFTFLVNLAQAAGSWIVQVLPAAAVVAFVVGGAYAARSAARSAGLADGRVASAAIGAALVFATLDGAPNIYQSLYWLTGMITYTLPLILLTLLVGWLLRRRDGDPPTQDAGPLVGVWLFTAVAGGLSETYAVLQAALLATAIVVSLVLPGRKGRRRFVAILGSALFGSSVALVLLYVAPGTTIRREMVVDPIGVVELVRHTLADGRLFIARTVKAIPMSLALAALIPAGVALWLRSSSSAEADRGPGRKTLLAWLLLLPPATGLFVLVSMLPYEYAVGDYPDARVLITGVYVLAAGMAAWGFVLGLILAVPRRDLAGRAALALGAVSLVLIGLSAFPVARKTLGQLPDATSFASSWDRRDVVLRDAARRNLDRVAAASLSHIGGLAEIGYDPNEWVNRCVAQAYGLHDVVAK